jgi:hypothetical protein
MPPPSKSRTSARRSKAGSRANKISLQTTLRVASAVKALSSTEGNHVGKAAEIIADGIRKRASQFSTKIPKEITIGQATPTTATIYAHGQPAVIIETGGRHPLFARGARDDPNRGHGWDHWYTQTKILFMEEGAKLALEDAAEEYGRTVDDWLREYG